MHNRISVLISSIITFVLFGACGPRAVSCAEPARREAGKPPAKITVEAGAHTRIDTPVSVALEAIPDVLRHSPIGLMEIRGSAERSVAKLFVTASQIEPGNPPRLWWVLSGTTPAGSRRVYELVEGGSPQVSGIEVTKNDSFLEIQAGDKKVLRYNNAAVPPPEGKSPLFTRSGFIHPLWSPSGTILTDIHPEDHIHHLGIWMAWTKTKFEGNEVDFWNLGDGKGTMRFAKLLSTTSGPVYGEFQSEHNHIALKTDANEKVVLKEVWDVRVYNIGGPEKGYWLWDFVSTQRCATDSPLYQMEYRYGGFGFRGAAQWEGENAMYLTSEGKTRKDGHGTRARWCDMAGRIGDKWQGVTIMSHPGNFRHPEPMRIWPEFEKQVFFNFAPSQLGDWIMEPGKDYVFRYRLYVHEGKVDVNDAERIWHDYADPPNVKLEPVSRTSKIILFDGKDFSHWMHKDGNPARWEIENSETKVVPGTGGIVTRQDFRDFKLPLCYGSIDLPKAD